MAHLLPPSEDANVNVVKVNSPQNAVGTARWKGGEMSMPKMQQNSESKHFFEKVKVKHWIKNESRKKEHRNASEFCRKSSESPRPRPAWLTGTAH